MLHVAQPSYSALVLKIGDSLKKRHTQYCVRRRMLPPALGGLRVLRAASPGLSCTREYGKDQLPCSHPQDMRIILHSLFRRQIAKLKIKARFDEITTRTKSRRMCRGEAVASERRPYQGGATDLHPALSSPSATPLRSGGYAGEVKRADGTSASAETTKKNAPYGR